MTASFGLEITFEVNGYKIPLDTAESCRKIIDAVEEWRYRHPCDTSLEHLGRYILSRFPQPETEYPELVWDAYPEGRVLEIAGFAEQGLNKVQTGPKMGLSRERIRQLAAGWHLFDFVEDREMPTCKKPSFGITRKHCSYCGLWLEPEKMAVKSHICKFCANLSSTARELRKNIGNKKPRLFRRGTHPE
jgi:hypothetical protein